MFLYYNSNRAIPHVCYMLFFQFHLYETCTFVLFKISLVIIVFEKYLNYATWSHSHKRTTLLNDVGSLQHSQLSQLGPAHQSVLFLTHRACVTENVLGSIPGSTRFFLSVGLPFFYCIRPLYYFSAS